MTPPMALLLAIIGVAMVLFSVEALPADVVGLGVLLVLILAGLLPPEQAFAGFGSSTVVMLFGLLVLTATLVRTGVAAMVVRVIRRWSRDSHARLGQVVVIVAALLSAVISNTATTALLLPVVLDLSRRSKSSASKLLMPLAFAAILSSSVTLVSSSTNLVISGLMSGARLPPLGMFELTPVGLPVAIVGVAYLLLLGRHLIPDRTGTQREERPFAVRPYTAEVVVPPDSPLVGQTLLQSKLGRDLDLTVLRVLRDDNHYLAPKPDLRLLAGDRLLVKGLHDDILQVTGQTGLAIRADVALTDLDLDRQDEQLVEAIVLPGSPMVGRTLKSLDFRRRYNLQVLGVNRHGQNIYRKLSQLPFRVGDQLLIQGSQASIALQDRYHLFRVISTVETQHPDVQRAPVAIAIFAAVLLLAGLNVLSLPVAAVLGVLLAFASGCITPAAAYREVEWKAIMVIGSMLALGAAMEHTGTAAYLANRIAAFAGQTAPIWLLSAFFGLTMLLTQPMSNQAAAVVVLPVALETAVQLGLNPRTFAVMIAVGASCSFITPLEPACLMVYGPGRYRFTDFVYVGLPLTLIVYALAIVLVPAIWPLG